ncbi:recombinase family protein [Bauldia litoralis]|uniref:recombinase family protein n=1 Tax=Bauldia litoralis TaxID=665467 RepID=UPI003266B1BA
MVKAALLRCAVYTRKSSEEGLEQDFNSLHAQREACEAYIASQKHEGWKALPAAYDDGGYSGGTMERPGLRALLADIASGTIDIVVVYKVDRLTRSLTDFAKIVEIFDKHGVSFVSVTQAFNTTTSMGRLTLNVLLSFAQFEREVTGERIRDKIAASKKKGMWMGGFVPIGYEAKDRTLAIVEPEAETVRTIYRLYLERKTVDSVKQELDRLDLTTKVRPGNSGTMKGGLSFSRGHLYKILANPLYAGRIHHKGDTYDGRHPAIIDQVTWDQVQARLAANTHARSVKAYSKNPSLLAGRLFDAGGEALNATHANKQGKRYRYYVSASALNAGRRRPTDPPLPAGVAADGLRPSPQRRWRLPAAEIEGVVIRILSAALTDQHWLAEHATISGTPIADRKAITEHSRELAAQLQGTDPSLKRGVVLALVDRIAIDDSQIEIAMRTNVLAGGDNEPSALDQDNEKPSHSYLTRAVSFRRRGPETKLVIDGDAHPEPEPDPALIKALAQSHRWWRDLLEQRYVTIRDLAGAYGTSERYVASIIRLAFVSPVLTRDILDGTQPPELTLHRFLKG